MSYTVICPPNNEKENNTKKGMKSDAIEKATLYLIRHYKTVSKLSDSLPPLSKHYDSSFMFNHPLLLANCTGYKNVSFPILILILKLERKERNRGLLFQGSGIKVVGYGGRAQKGAVRLSRWILLTETIQKYEISRFLLSQGA